MNHLPCHQAHYKFHKLNNHHHNRRGNHHQRHSFNHHHNRRGNHNQRHNQRIINQAGLSQADLSQEASLTHKMVGHAVVAGDASQGA